MSLTETVVARRTAIALLDYWFLVLILASPVAMPFNKAIVLPIVIAAALPGFALASILLWRSGRAQGETLAYHDELTGIGNRRAFVARTRSLLKRRKIGAVALALLDVDGLKSVNDGCGHQAGDELIASLGQRLSDHHESVYRIGGDEFAVVIDRDSGESLTSILPHLEPFDQLFVTCGHMHRVCISYGQASSHPGETLESLFARADARLRQCKRRLYASGDLPDRRHATRVAEDPNFGWSHTPVASLPEARRARASGED